MITMHDIKILLKRVNELTNQDLHIFQYTRAKNPYGLMDDRSQQVFRGTKEDLYNYLTGAIEGINSYKLALDNAGLDIELLLESLNQSTSE